VLPRLAPGTPVSVHDVFHGRRPWPVSEGRVLLRWLGERGIGWVTASAAADPDLHERLVGLKRKLGLSAPVHGSRQGWRHGLRGDGAGQGGRNPMLFFQTPL
jgi:hypothetical protein